MSFELLELQDELLPVQVNQGVKGSLMMGLLVVACFGKSITWLCCWGAEMQLPIPSGKPWFGAGKSK